MLRVGADVRESLSWMLGGGPAIQIGETLLEERMLVSGEGGEAAGDEIDRAGLAGPRSVVGWNDERGERFEITGLLG